MPATKNAVSRVISSLYPRPGLSYAEPRPSRFYVSIRGYAPYYFDLLLRKGKQMSDKAQTWFLTVLTIVVFEIVKGPLSNILLAEKVPGNRGPSEDVVDALLA